MFEGRTNEKPVHQQRESTDLHQFRWTDLGAKLAATRDMRDELGKVEGGFNAFGEARRENSDESKRIVNHAALSDGKAARLSRGDAANDAVHGDREKE